MEYRPDIDGLRAVAVLTIVFFHAGSNAFGGGYVGVDVFFVISGFLITRMIAGEIGRGTFSLATFYERRARRLLPALAVVMAASMLAGWFMLLPDELENLGESVVASAAFFSNVYFWIKQDYFAPAADQLPLLHTWSLGVEEQFYIVFPLLLIALAGMARRRLGLAIFGLCALSLLFSELALRDRPSLAFFLLPARAWEFGLGAALALGLVPAMRGRMSAEFASTAGMAMLAGAVATFDPATRFPGIHALLPCLGAALVIHAGGGCRPLVNRVLAMPPAVFIGTISYSLYLWHWPVFAFLRIRLGSADPTPAIGAAALAGIMILALLSWRFVELPFRDRTRLKRRPAIAACLSMTLAALTAGFVLFASGGVAGRLDGSAARLMAARGDFHPQRNACEARPPQRLCRIGAPSEARVLFWGDSHAGALMDAADVAARTAGKGALIAWKGRCPPVLGIRRIGEDGALECAAYNGRMVEWLQRGGRSIDTIVLAGRWAATVTGRRMPGEGGGDIELASETGGSGGNAELFRAGLAATLAAISAPGRRIVILGGVPEIGWDVPRALASAVWLGSVPPPPPSPEAVSARQESADLVLAEAAAATRAEFVPLAPLLCDPQCRLGEGDRLFYIDGHHLSSAGGEFIGERLGRLLWAAPLAEQRSPAGSALPSNEQEFTTR